jgi:hypothetical protein
MSIQSSVAGMPRKKTTALAILRAQPGNAMRRIKKWQ